MQRKAKVQAYPLQVTEIPGCPFDKITIDLVTEWETSSSGNKHILTIIDHLTGLPEAFPIPDRLADGQYCLLSSTSTFQFIYAPGIYCQIMAQSSKRPPHGPSTSTARN